jgi:hypothetical protein
MKNMQQRHKYYTVIYMDDLKLIDKEEELQK